MILTLAFGALHTWGGFEVWHLNGCGPNLCFPKALGQIPDSHGENPATCHVTFATEIRHHFALGDMNCDNHIGRGASKYIYTYIIHNASTQSRKVNVYILRVWPKI